MKNIFKNNTLKICHKFVKCCKAMLKNNTIKFYNKSNFVNARYNLL